MYRHYLLLLPLVFAYNSVYSVEINPVFDVQNNRQVIYLGSANTDEIEANNFFADAEKLEKQGSYNDALTLFGKAAFEYNNAKLKNKYAATLIRISEIHRILKNYKAAEDVVLNVVLRTYSKLGNRVGEMNSYQLLGKIYFDAGKLTQSLWFFTQQGMLAQKIANKHSYIESVIDIARLKIKKKEFVLATADINRAELLAKNANTTKFRSQISGIRKDIKDRS